MEGWNCQPPKKNKKKQKKNKTKETKKKKKKKIFLSMENHIRNSLFFNLEKGK